MRTLLLVLCFMLMGVTLAGCSNEEASVQLQEEEFHYLQDLTDEEAIAYDKFATENNWNYLAKFTPEKILLVYLHSVFLDDVEAIYTLTYDDGTLPDLEAFSEKYYAAWGHSELDATLDYRFYDTIKIREEGKTADNVTIEINVTYGLLSASTIYGMQKQDNVWKMDIWHAFSD